MTDFFDYFVHKEYPNGATPEEKRKVSDMLNELENEIFNRLPWLIDHFPKPVLLDDEKANEVVKAIYDIIKAQ